MMKTERFKIKVDRVLSYQAGIVHKHRGVGFTKKYIDFQEEVRSQIPDDIFIPEDKPLIFNITINFHIPKSYSKKKKEACRGQYCMKNIDLDNINKGIQDIVSRKLGFDDKHIVILRGQKKYNLDIEEEKDIITIDISYDFGKITMLTPQKEK